MQRLLFVDLNKAPPRSITSFPSQLRPLSNALHSEFVVSAFYLKQLDTNNRENEQEQYSDDEDVENVFQGVHHALEHSLQKHKISVR